MLRAALLGVGGISGAHVPGWQNRTDVELVAVCDVREEQLTECGDIHKYTDFNEMLDKEKIDILDICLPTYLHKEYSIAALKKGIHVICEKPVSLNKEDVQLIYHTAKENHVYFMPAHVLRFWPEYVKLKEIYDSKQYGELLSGWMGRLGTIPGWSFENWMREEEKSGLVPFDLQIHDIDFMIYMLGKPKNIVKHRVKRPEQDYVQTISEYDGYFVTSESSWYASPYPFRAEYRFLFENAIVAYEKGQLTIYQNDGVVVSAEENESEGGKVINVPKTDAYAEEIAYFVECVKAQREPDRIKPQELEMVIDLLKM